MSELNIGAQALVARAQRRIEKIGGRTDLITTDPLLAEIALAELDATLAIAQELHLINKRLYSNEPLNIMLPYHQAETMGGAGWSGGGTLRTEFVKLNQTLTALRHDLQARPQPIKRRWWQRWLFP